MIGNAFLAATLAAGLIAVSANAATTTTQTRTEHKTTNGAHHKQPMRATKGKATGSNAAAREATRRLNEQQLASLGGQGSMMPPAASPTSQPMTQPTMQAPVAAPADPINSGTAAPPADPMASPNGAASMPPPRN
jgi:hypothetical protein